MTNMADQQATTACYMTRFQLGEPFVILSVGLHLTSRFCRTEPRRASGGAVELDRYRMTPRRILSIAALIGFCLIVAGCYPEQYQAEVCSELCRPNGGVAELSPIYGCRCAGTGDGQGAGS